MLIAGFPEVKSPNTEVKPTETEINLPKKELESLEKGVKSPKIVTTSPKREAKSPEAAATRSPGAQVKDNPETKVGPQGMTVDQNSAEAASSGERKLSPDKAPVSSSREVQKRRAPAESIQEAAKRLKLNLSGKFWAVLLCAKHLLCSVSLHSNCRLCKGPIFRW